MGAQAISKPELALQQILVGLNNNPAAPINIKKDPMVIDRLLGADFKAAWEILTPTEAAMLAGKAKPTLRSVNSGINKVRKLFKYELPMCDEEVGDCSTVICDVSATTSEQYGYLEVGIDQCSSMSWKLNPSELANLTESVAERRAQYLRRKAHSLKVAANRAIISQLYTLVSDYADGTDAMTTPKALTLISDKGDILPVGKAKIDKEYRQSLFKGEYVIFGGETIADYFSVKGYRLSPEGKMGVSDAMADLPFVYDSDFDSLIQEAAEDELSHAIIVPIGSVILDTWVQNTGDMYMNTPTRLSTVLTIDGIQYDYDLYIDECTKDIMEKLTLNYGMGSLPDSIYCDENGLIRHYTVQCGPFECETI